MVDVVLWALLGLALGSFIFALVLGVLADAGILDKAAARGGPPGLLMAGLTTSCGAFSVASALYAVSAGPLWSVAIGTVATAAGAVVSYVSFVKPAKPEPETERPAERSAD